MARSWAITYVLRDQMTILFPLVIEALGGRPVESLLPGRQEDVDRRASGLGDDPRLTAEAAPSVASAFSRLTTLRATGIRQAVSVLADGLKKWPYNKARFIEALAMYQTDDVRDILIKLGNGELEDRSDLASLQYVAQGLSDLSVTTPLSACSNGLRGIWASTRYLADVRTKRCTSKMGGTCPNRRKKKSYMVWPC